MTDNSILKEKAPVNVINRGYEELNIWILFEMRMTENWRFDSTVLGNSNEAEINKSFGSLIALLFTITYSFKTYLL